MESMAGEYESKIFAVKNNDEFVAIANDVFQFQYHNNQVYKQWCDRIGVNVASSLALHQIPYLPISFFKSHTITSTLFKPTTIFESSGTTTTINSKHFVKDITLYKKSFNTTFKAFYGDIKDWCILGLLPSYLERNNSSLIMMVQELISESKHPQSGFYLNDLDLLFTTIQQLENAQQKTLLFGVTFALLDFAEKYKLPLNYTTIIETGGMKGRRKEMTRSEVHAILKESFQTNSIHSEYGMTELLSQAYATSNGKFICPPYMKVLLREEDDPLQILQKGRGVLQIIDLANIYSCSFIATEDVGIVYEDGSFEVHGRLDNTDIRGCSLLVV